MDEQIDQLQKLKNKLEKEKQTVKSELDDLRTQIEHLQKGKAAAEKLSKQLEKQLNGIQTKIEDHVKQMTDLNHSKTKLSSENSDLTRQIEEFERQIGTLNKAKTALQQQLDEAKRTLDDELRGKGSILNIRYLTSDLEQVREQLDEEQEAKIELQRQVTKLNAEVQQWRAHFQSQGIDRGEEFEEGEEQVEAALNKCNALEKVKPRLQGNVEDLMDLIDQLSEGGKSVHELEKSRKRAELEKEELQAALEDAQATLEQEEAKKLQSDINDLEVALDHANRTNADLQKTLKRIQQNITELQTQIEEEQRQRDKAREPAAVAERRANLINGELEELPTALKQAERAHKAAENELHDAVDRISETNTQNANLFSQRRQLESTIAAMQADLDEAVSELKNNEEHAKKAKQDHALQVERLRKGLEQQVKDLQTHLDEAEANSLKGGKCVIAKLEQRIHELENENELEQHRHQETLKELRRNDRRLKELAFQTEEDRQNQLRLQDLTEKLQSKIKVYKQKIAAISLAKFRKVQTELGELINEKKQGKTIENVFLFAEDSGERADLAENQLGKLRAKNRSSVSASRTSPARELREATTTVRATSTLRAGSVRQR
ncbi:unnamed protein product [Rotaria sordida]|nr:unnamed protein product [Rotaria sordida]